MILGIGTDHKARLVHEIDHRNMEGVAQLHHAFGFLRTIGGHGAGKMPAVVGNNADNGTVEPRQTGYLALAKKR